jgi:GNAT superfamily N-acetyltransferase
MMLSKAELAARLPEFVELSRECFGKPIPEAIWRWRYIDQPDDTLAMNVRVEEGRIVANYSACGLVLSWGGEVRKALLSMSTMTHPAYAGRGLFTALADELYAAGAERGYAAVLGFPNRNSHGGFVGRLRWADIYEIPTLQLDRAGLAADRGSCALAPVERVPREIEEPAWMSELLHVQRTKTYLDWRFASNPMNEYSIGVPDSSGPVRTLAVSKWYEGQLDLVEFLAADAKEAAELLRNLIAYARGAAAAGINLWLPVHCPYRSVFEKAGFTNGAPVTYFGARGLPDPARFDGFAGDFRSFRSWHVQMSDSDVY